MTDTKLICVTPVKNEAWILRRHLACASTWADHIILADQMSTDGTREIAASFPKVTLLDNRGEGYHEGQRQRIALNAARAIPGRRILIAVDADEAISANWMISDEWEKVRAAAPGTVIRFNWVNVLPGADRCWTPPECIAMGFVDDGTSEFADGRFHITRLPVPVGAPELVLNDVKMLHFQYIDWDRMKSKQARYQCAERIANPAKRAINLFRQYHNMDAIAPERLGPFRNDWVEAYEQLGIEMRSVEHPDVYATDREVIELFLQHGRSPFKKLDVWSIDWAAKASRLGIQLPPDGLGDPRSRLEKTIHRWLAATQGRKYEPRVRAVQWALKLAGW